MELVHTLVGDKLTGIPGIGDRLDAQGEAISNLCESMETLANQAQRRTEQAVTTMAENFDVHNELSKAKDFE